MIRQSLLGAGVIITLTGCQMSQAPQYSFMRADLQRMKGNSALESQYELDKTVCLGETQKSAVGMAPIYYQGLGGAIGAAMIENQRGDALKDVARGCMAQRGYLYVTKEDGESRLAEAEASRSKKSGKRS